MLARAGADTLLLERYGFFGGVAAHWAHSRGGKWGTQFLGSLWVGLWTTCGKYSA